MIIDAFRAIIIGTKFVLWDVPKAIITFLFLRQNEKLKDAFSRRIRARDR
jgi:hypothetical protein